MGELLKGTFLPILSRIWPPGKGPLLSRSGGGFCPDLGVSGVLSQIVGFVPKYNPIYGVVQLRVGGAPPVPIAVYPYMGSYMGSKMVKSENNLENPENP